jgi:hypothetical protein
MSVSNDIEVLYVEIKQMQEMKKSGMTKSKRELLEKAVAMHVDKMDLETLVYLVENQVYMQLLDSDQQDVDDFIAEELI